MVGTFRVWCPESVNFLHIKPQKVLTFRGMKPGKWMLNNKHSEKWVKMLSFCHPFVARSLVSHFPGKICRKWALSKYHTPESGHWADFKNLILQSLQIFLFLFKFSWRYSNSQLLMGNTYLLQGVKIPQQSIHRAGESTVNSGESISKLPGVAHSGESLGIPRRYILRGSDFEVFLIQAFAPLL